MMGDADEGRRYNQLAIAVYLDGARLTAYY